MAHLTSKSYFNLQKRLDKAPQGAPSSESLFKILEILFDKNEAELVSVLPINFFTLEDASRCWNKSIKESKLFLDKLADKGIIFDFKNNKTQAYFLAPPLPGFLEMSLMRLDGKFNKKILSELFYQYINNEPKFVRQLVGLKTHPGRVLIQESSITPKIRSEILDYERASEIINSASCITVGICYCRHKMEHVGKACNNPQEVCLTFNNVAETLVKHKIARKIKKSEAFKILNDCIDRGLVQIGDNVQDKVNWICNCCSCCCEALVTYRRLGYNPKLNSNFVSKHHDTECIACGICVQKCPVDAIHIFTHKKTGEKYARVSQEKCIGCGICVRFCPTKSRIIERRSKTKFVPKDTFERLIMTAIERGKLQNLIFDNHKLITSEILQKLVGIILSLKPTKMILLNKYFKSRFLTMISKTSKYTLFDKLFNDGKLDYSHPELKKNK